ncbi:TadE family protein [Sinomonas sp. JGH33]|uniref:TadE family protein n=1 Tax=Sinomonas terricola TaxID=3110330 RepID=A0ABU5TC82_9MICC|nr:TadE family protein [Sinomonas sp. JGH33]MEA5457299.1 TadE family protein [Sinomonas sp. JGH33]
MSWKRSDDVERGSVTLENVIVLPAVLLLLFGTFQAAFWMNARNVAGAAADAAYSAARAYQAPPGAGETAAGRVLASNRLDAARVSVQRTGTTVTVTVTGSSGTIVAGWGGPAVSATRTGPVERVTTP